MSDISNGAHFVKADLHIHSYGNGGSYDVADSQMNLQNIVDTAIEKGLSVISITDHNEYLNSCAADGTCREVEDTTAPGYTRR